MVSQSEVADTFPVRIYWDTVEAKLLVCELCPLSEQRRALEAMAEASGVALRSQPAAAGASSSAAAGAGGAKAASPSKEAGAGGKTSGALTASSITEANTHILHNCAVLRTRVTYEFKCISLCNEK